MRNKNKYTRPQYANSHMSDFLPAGRTPPSVLLSSESAAARALMGDWCRPCGVTETVLWACQSCWSKDETCWSILITWVWAMPASPSLPRLCVSHWSIIQWPFDPQQSLRSWITALAAVDRLWWLWLGVNGRTCLWTAPSRWPASAAPCAKKQAVKSLTLDYGNVLCSVKRRTRWDLTICRCPHAFFHSHGSPGNYSACCWHLRLPLCAELQ